MTTIAPSLSDNERTVLETLRDASNTYPDGSFHPIAYASDTLAAWADLPPSETRTVLRCLHERGLVQRRAPVRRDQLVVVLDEAAAEFTYQLKHAALGLIGHGAPGRRQRGPGQRGGRLMDGALVYLAPQHRIGFLARGEVGDIVDTDTDQVIARDVPVAEARERVTALYAALVVEDALTTLADGVPDAELRAIIRRFDAWRGRLQAAGGAAVTPYDEPRVNISAGPLFTAGDGEVSGAGHGPVGQALDGLRERILELAAGIPNPGFYEGIDPEEARLAVALDVTVTLDRESGPS